MYQLLKDCLLFPKNIINHLNMKKSLFVIYVIILFLLFATPSMLAGARNLNASDDLVNAMIDDFNDNDTVHYQIYGGLLFSTIETDKGQIFGAKNLSKLLNLPVYMGFDPLDKLNPLIERNSLLIVFRFNSLELWYMEKGEVMGANDDKFYVSGGNVKISKCLATVTYESLGLMNFNFSTIKTDDQATVNKNISSLLNMIISKYQGLYLLVLLPTIFIVEAVILMISILLMTLIAFFLYRGLGLKFGRIMKLCLLCTTPMIILNFSHLLINSTIIDFMGELITVVYLMIAINNIAKTILYNNIKKE